MLSSFVSVAALFFIWFSRVQGNECATSQTVGIPLSMRGTNVEEEIVSFSDSCASFQFSDQSSWFRISPIANTLLTIDTCGSCFDTMLSVYTSNCNDLECLANNDDTNTICNMTNNNQCSNYVSGILTSSVSFCATEPEYFIKVSGFAGSVGEFTLHIEEEGSCSVPQNNKCSSAFEITSLPQSASFNNEFASGGFINCGNVGESEHSVWYKVIGTGGTLVLSTCDPTTNFQTAIAVLSGECEDFRCVASNDVNSVSCPVQRLSSLEFCSEEGVEYSIMVTGKQGAFGDAVLSISPGSASTCEIVEGDGRCTSPREIEFYYGLFTALGETEVDSTNSVDFPSCFTSNSNKDSMKWFSFTGSGSSVFVDSLGSDFDTVLSVFSGSCFDLRCVVWNDDYNDSLQSGLSFCAESGVQYFVGLGSFGLNTGSYVINAYDFGPCVQESICEEVEVTLAFPTLTNGDLAMATSVPFPYETCSSSPIGSQNIWYRITGEGSTLSVTTCNSCFDTVLTVFEPMDNCNDVRCIAVNDDHSGECIEESVNQCTNFYTSALTFCAGAGIDYFIVVSGYNGETGLVVLRITDLLDSCLSNDQCEFARPVVFDEPEFIEAHYGYDDTFIECNDVIEGYGSGWYTVEGTGGIVNVDLMSPYNGTYDLVGTNVIVLTSRNGSCINQNFDTCIEGKTLEEGRISFCTKPGNTYWIGIGSREQEDPAFVQFIFTEGGSCVDTDNQICETGLSFDISNGFYTSGNTEYAGGDLGRFSCEDVLFEPPSQEWFSFVGNGRNVQISACGSSFDTILAVIEASCEFRSCVAQSDDYEGCGTASRVDFCALSEVEYFVILSGFNQTFGDFELSITEGNRCADKDTCSQSTSVAIPTIFNGTTLSSTSVDIVEYRIPLTQCLFGDASGIVNTQWYTFQSNQANMIELWGGLSEIQVTMGLFFTNCDIHRTTCIPFVSSSSRTYYQTVCGASTSDYYLMVAGVRDERGNYQIEISYLNQITCSIENAPVSSCEEAHTISELPHVVFGDTSTVVPFFDSTCDGDLSGGDEQQLLAGYDWFSLLGAGQVITISFGNTPKEYNFYFSVYSECGGSSSCVETSADPYYHSMSFCGIPGETYSIMLGSLGSHETGGYEVSFSSGEICVAPPSHPTIITVTKSTTSLSFEWEAPFSYGFPIEKYTYVLQDAYYNNVTVGQTQDNRLTIDDLESGTLYTFYVAASTEWGRGLFGFKNEETMIGSCQLNFESFDDSKQEAGGSIFDAMLRGHIFTPSSNAIVHNVEVQTGTMYFGGFLYLYLYENTYALDDLYQLIDEQEIVADQFFSNSTFYFEDLDWKFCDNKRYFVAIITDGNLWTLPDVTSGSSCLGDHFGVSVSALFLDNFRTTFWYDPALDHDIYQFRMDVELTDTILTSSAPVVSEFFTTVTSATISWRESCSSSPITGYSVAISPNFEEIFLGPNAIEFSFSGLMKGTNYTIEVYAINSNGAGEVTTQEVATLTDRYSVQWLRQSTDTIGGVNVRSIAVDEEQNSYVVGVFEGITHFGDFQLQANLFVSDAFVIKYDEVGSVVWAIHLGRTTNGFASANGVSVDSVGNVYVVGDFQNSIQLEDDRDPIRAAISSTISAYIAKYSSEGELLFSKHIGNELGFDVYGSDVACDGEDRAFFFGDTESSYTRFNDDDFFEYYGEKGSLIAAYSSTGELENIVSIGGAQNSGSITTDEEGSVYVAGNFFSSVFIPSNQTEPLYLPENSNGTFVSKFDDSLSPVWMVGLNDAFSASVEVSFDLLTFSGDFSTSDGILLVSPSSNNTDSFPAPVEALGEADAILGGPFVMGLDSASGEFRWINTISVATSSASVSDITITNSTVVGTGFYSGEIYFGEDFQGIPFQTSQEESSFFVGIDKETGEVIWSRWAGSQFFYQSGDAIDSVGEFVYAAGSFTGSASFSCKVTVATNALEAYVVQMRPSDQTTDDEDNEDIEAECQFTVLRDETGKIQFPPAGFMTYPNGIECTWLIDVEDVPHIMAIVTTFELANAGDSLTFFDGDSASAPVLHHYTGETAVVNDAAEVYYDDYYQRLELQVQSTGSQLFVKFKSDACFKGLGFEVSFASSQTASFCDADFPQVLVLQQGLVAQRQKGGYRDNSDCYFYIQPPSSQYVFLSFLQFDLSSEDYVEFIDENGREAVTLARFYGDDAIYPIQSLGQRITVHFVSGEALYDRGFIISYQGIDEAIFCVPLAKASGGSGVITSQQGEDFYIPAASCSWDITVDPSFYDSVYMYFDSYDVPSPGYVDVQVTRTSIFDVDQVVTLSGNNEELFISDSQIVINFEAEGTFGKGFHGEYCGHPIGGACENSILTNDTVMFDNHFCGEYYESNSNCQWTFAPEVAGPINYLMLSFFSLDFQNEDDSRPDDFITILSSGSTIKLSSSKEDLSEAPTFIFDSASLSVLFQSDEYLSGGGFDAIACASYQGSDKECSGIKEFEEPEGIFTNQFCGKIYNSDAACTWKFDSKTPALFTMVILRNLNFGSETFNGVQWADNVIVLDNRSPVRYFNRGGSHSARDLPSDQETGNPIENTEVIAVFGPASVEFSSDNVGFADGFDGSFCVFVEGDNRLCKESDLFTTASGSFHNHACNGYYQANADCKYVVNPSTGSDADIVLYVTSVDFINSGNALVDFIKIYDGVVAEPQFQIGGFNRSRTYYETEAVGDDGVFPKTFFAGSGQMTVEFVSDGAIFGEGFDAEYCTVPKPAATCGGGRIFTESSSRFQDRQCGPSYYRPMNCRWDFVPNNLDFQFIVLIFHSLDLGPGARVEVYDPASDITYRSDEHLNNVEEETQIVEGSAVFVSSATSYMQFIVSNSAILKEGWDVEYLTVTDTGICEGENQFMASEGIIQDHLYGDFYAPDRQCSFLIEIPSARAITIRFEYFDLEEGFDFLEVYDGNGWNAELIGFLSGDEEPLPFTSSSNSLYFTFRSDASISGRGFSIFYQDADLVECPLFCSGFGECVNDACECEEGKFGLGCEILPAPVPVESLFLDSLATISIVFDKATDRAGMFGSSSTDCSILFIESERAQLGGDARCVWKSDQQLLIRAGRGASIMPGDSLTMRGGIRESNPTEQHPISDDVTFIISSPKKPVVPQAVIVGTDVLLPNRDLLLDGSASLFTGGRDLFFIWSLDEVCVEDVCSAPGEELGDLVSGEHAAELFIEAAYFRDYDVSSTLYFSCVAVNFLEVASDPIQHIVKGSPLQLPGLVFTGPTQYTINRDEDLLINSNINFSDESFALLVGADDCPNIQWKWTLFCESSDCGSLPALEGDSEPSILLPSNFFEHGASYRLHLLVSYVEQDSFSILDNSGDVFVHINPFQLDVSIVGGIQVFSLLDAIQLSTELVEDQQSLASSVTYRWACRKASGYLCQKQDSSFLSLADTGSAVIPQGSLPPGEYIFSVIASYETDFLLSRSRSSIPVRILRRDQPLVSITRSGSRGKHDARSPLVLLANVDSTVTSLQWSVAEGDLVLADSLQSQTSTTAEIVIAPNTLQDGATYRFKVEVTSSNGNTNTAQIEVLVNEGPTAGSVSVDIAFGFSVETEFTFFAAATDDSADMPLHYVFALLPLSCPGSVLADGSCPIIPISNQLDFPRFTALLPPGEYLPVVDVFDRLGAFSRFTGSEVITSYNSCPATSRRMTEFMQELAVQARAFACLGAKDTLRQIVNIASVTLNCYGPDIPQEVLDIYFDQLEGFLVSVDASVPSTKIFVDNRLKSFILASAVPSYGGTDNIGRLLANSAAVAAAAQQNGLLRADSAQSLLNGISNVISAEDIGSANGDTVLRALEGLAGALLKDNTCGNVPKSLLSNNIDLESQRKAKADLAGSSIQPSGDSGPTFIIPADTNSLSSCVNYAATNFKKNLFGSPNVTNSDPVDLTFTNEEGEIIPFVSSQPIEIRVPKKGPTEETLVCASWDEENNEWRQDCTFIGETEDSYILQTSHLTSFAVLLSGVGGGGGGGPPSISSFGSFDSQFTGATELFGETNLDAAGNLVSDFTALSDIPTYAFATSNTVYDILQYSYKSSDDDQWTIDRILTLVFVGIAFCGIVFCIMFLSIPAVRDYASGKKGRITQIKSLRQKQRKTEMEDLDAGGNLTR